MTSLKTITDHLDDSALLKVNSKLLARLYSGLEVGMDKASAPLLLVLARFLVKHTRREAALYAVKEGAIPRIHGLMTEAPSQALVEELSRLMAQLAVLTDYAMPLRDLVQLSASPY